MSVVEANIAVDISDDDRIDQYIEEIKREITNITGKPTKINVIEVDDPVSMSPISLRNLKV